MEFRPAVFSIEIEQGCRIPSIIDSGYSPIECSTFTKPKDGDIVLCSYPASGEDILLSAVRSIVTTSKKEKKKFCEQPPTDIDHQGSDIENSDVHVTNLPFCRARWNPNCRYILLLRNPKQVCVTFYYLYNRIYFDMYKQLPDENCSFNTFYRLFINGKTAYGDYFDHTRSWLGRSCTNSCDCDTVKDIVDDNGNFLVIIYEDLQDDSEYNLRRIAQFLRVPPSNMTSIPDDVGRIVRSLRKDSEGSEGIDEEGGTRRKMGLSAGWQSHFSREHRAAFEEWIQWNGNAFVYNRFWFDSLR